MDLLSTLFPLFSKVGFPQDLVGWSGFLALAGVIIFLLWKWRKYNQLLGIRQIFLLAGLIALTVLFHLIPASKLPFESAAPPPQIPLELNEPSILYLSALPWMLAAGLLGPLPGAILGLLAGFLTGLWQTHSLFSMIETALLALFFWAILRQRYRTPFFRLLRHPLPVAILLGMLFPIIHLAILLLSARGMLVNRLDYSLRMLPSALVKVEIELLIAGLCVEAIRLLAPQTWRDTTPLRPSPAEKSLQMRFITSMAPLAFVLVATLMIGDWLVAGQAARDMLRDRLANAAQMAADSIPYFLETGQSMVAELVSDPRLLSDDKQALNDVLAQDIKAVPFFNQFTIIGPDEQVIASYPTANYVGQQTPIDEQIGIQLAFSSDVPFQIFTIPPAAEQVTAQVSFVASIFDQSNRTRRVLVARADLDTNPFAKPIIASIDKLTGQDDVGMLLDGEGRILVHPNAGQVMTAYLGKLPPAEAFYDQDQPDGTRMLVYYKPTVGRDWAVVLMIPVYRAQQLALDIATPLLAMIFILAVIALIILSLGLRMVTGSMQTLAWEAEKIAQGRLDHPLAAEGSDEVGQLRRAFEQMRVSLKARLDELNRLLLVSQGVASSLEVSEAVQPILEAAMATGASSARVVLSPSIIPDLDGAPAAPLSFGLGPTQNIYRDLDEQILALTRQQDRLVLSNLYRPRLLNFSPAAPHPESVMAVALRHENLYYGALWVAYDQQHVFSEEEVRFTVTLGGQAALAAANARLFSTAEIGRQRLESILASSPDPVLVTDQRDQLVLANPAAWQVLGLSMEATDHGRPISQVIQEPELINLLRTSNTEKLSTELTLPGGRVFLATATPVMAERQRGGRVCVLRDVTHFKELDALKSEFVSTVSHDLRSPLTLMRGYATMLEMVGQLNEQQNSYVQKIVSGVESMARLVNNLLDLGRIESGVGLQLETINIQDVVERVTGSLQLQAAQKRIQLTCEFPAQSVPLIEADQALLQQALHNLVENAIKYTRADGKVHVRVRTQPIGVVFEVIDNGIGISPVDQPRLFEKFYRGAQHGSKDQRGTGLGLAIVKSIAERHGGRIWAESQLGKGSTFYLTIPLRQSVREVEI